MLLFWQGLVIGLSIAAPVGPISILVIHRALSDGWRLGMVSGLGASVANMVYGALAGAGMSLLSTYLIAWHRVIAFIGAVLVAGIGVRFLLEKPAAKVEHPPVDGALVAFGTTLGLTLANPVGILLFAAIFTSVHLQGISSGDTVLRLITGIFVGSTLWWLVLCSAATLAQREFHLDHGHTINRVAGAVLLALAVLMVVRAL